jgi:hypothetical protein
MAPMALYNAGVDNGIVRAWLLLLQLFRALTRPSFAESDLAGLEQQIQTFVRVSVVMFPTCRERSKLHHLVHYPLFVRRFGSPTAFSTESFEALNPVSRKFLQSYKSEIDCEGALKGFGYRDMVVHCLRGGLLRTASGSLSESGDGLRQLGLHPAFVQVFSDPTGDVKIRPLDFVTRKNGGGVYYVATENTLRRCRITPLVDSQGLSSLWISHEEEGFVGDDFRLLNVQHDCRLAKCEIDLTGHKPEMKHNKKNAFVYVR